MTKKGCHVCLFFERPCAFVFNGDVCVKMQITTLKVGLYFWRSQAPITPPRPALVRAINWRVPIGVSMHKRRSKKYKPTRVHKPWQKLNDFQDIV